MSRRRRRAHEAGPVRKTVEVLVSALFGMAVVGVILVLLQGGSSPASQGPGPQGVGTTQAGLDGGGDGGLGIRSADPGTQSSASGTIYSAQPAPTRSQPTEGATVAQQTGTTVPTGGAGTTAKGGGGSSTGASATATASASTSSSASTGALGGVVGGLVGGVLGLL